ncbi:hypothetical protein [Rhodoplanes sp. SY1]|uniref:hypothetical protein n=1 Tax=Rhodoplanes sp. SY1 TaxID=3166646 RepID=UPI0038B5C764
MTKLLDRAVAAARTLPPELQDDIARVVLSLAGDDTTVQLSPEEQGAIARSKAAAADSAFATDDQVRDLWNKHGL